MSSLSELPPARERPQGRGPPRQARRERHALVAILGNPNSGKSTLFNRLTGMRAKVGNYPGVTVEKKVGEVHAPIRRRGGRARSPRHLQPAPGFAGRDDRARRAVRPVTRIRRSPDLVVFVVDATQLERHLFLALQLIEIGRPVVLARQHDRRGAHGRYCHRRRGAPVPPRRAGRVDIRGEGNRHRQSAPADGSGRGAVGAHVPPAPRAQVQRVLDNLSARLPAARPPLAHRPHGPRRGHPARRRRGRRHRALRPARRAGRPARAAPPPRRELARLARRRRARRIRGDRRHHARRGVAAAARAVRRAPARASTVC